MASGVTVVNLSTLGLQQLDQLKTSLEEVSYCTLDTPAISYLLGSKFNNWVNGAVKGRPAKVCRI